MPDLSRLSDAERRVLLLLAQGHTSKSAASALGVTEGAINERLREARRKTGVGSSRELARLAAASQETSQETPQEIRDEEIGVASPAAGRHHLDRPFPIRARWPVLIGALSMIVLASAVGAFAALAIAGPQGPPRVVKTYPVAGAVVPAGPLTLKVTFDRPMRPGSWSFVNRDAASTPPCDWRRPVQSPDGRGFSVSCKLERGHAYWIGFNSANHQNFVSPDGVPATPAGLGFSTK